MFAIGSLSRLSRGLKADLPQSILKSTNSKRNVVLSSFSSPSPSSFFSLSRKPSQSMIWTREMTKEERGFEEIQEKIKKRLESIKQRNDGFPVSPKMSTDLINALDSLKEGKLEDASTFITKAMATDIHPNLYNYRIQINDKLFSLYFRLLESLPKEKTEARNKLLKKMVDVRLLLETDLEHIMNSEPENPYPYLIRGRHRATDFGEMEGALQDFQKAAEVNPVVPEPKVAIADWYVTNNKPQLAIRYYDKVLLMKSLPSLIRVSVLCKRGDALAKAKQWGAALESFKTAKEVDSKHVSPYEFIKNLVIQYDKEAQGQLGKRWYVEMNNAINAIIRILESRINGSNQMKFNDEMMSNLYLERGYAMAKLQNFVEAIQDYKTALDFNPQSHSIYASLATTLQEAGRTEEALQNITKAVEFAVQIKNNKLTSFYLNKRGAFKLQNETPKEALADFNESLKLKEDSISCRHNKVRALFQLKEYEECLKEAEYLIDKNPNNALFYVWRGYAAGELKDLETLENSIKKGIEMDREAVLNQFPEIYGTISRKLHNVGGSEKLQEALSYVNQEITTGTRNKPIWLVFRGWLHVQLNNNDEAIKDANESLKLEPGSLEAFSLRATAHASKLEFEAALKDAQEAVRFHPKNSDAIGLLNEITQTRQAQYALAGIPLTKEGNIKPEWLSKQKENKGLPNDKRKEIKGPRVDPSDLIK